MSTTQYSQLNSNLYHAALTGDIELARQSIAQGADVHYRELNRSVLEAAVMGDNIEVAEYLLQHGADPNMKSTDGLTPLMQANSDNMVKLLDQYGADPKICDENGNTAFMYFAVYDIRNAIKAWLELGFPIARRKMKQLINQLLMKGRFEMISLLTGYQFKSENTIVRIAEFKAARYAV
ncbi:MAG: ankyrin repeat domain-containing protein [Negativicutes bacterium]|nr:ankyrin repeat domain-containing protein [Negativicutes bacterium]